MNDMNKDRFIELLRSTRRNGIETVIAKLEELGFFEAPASTRFHLNRKGGLLEHSLNVYEAAMMVREKIVQRNPELEIQLSVESVILSTLLHDTCKADIYKSAIRRSFPGIRSITRTFRSDTGKNPSSCFFPGDWSSPRRRCWPSAGT